MPKYMVHYSDITNTYYLVFDNSRGLARYYANMTKCEQDMFGIVRHLDSYRALMFVGGQR